MKKGPSFKTMIIGLIVFGIGVVAAIPSKIVADQKYETDLSEAEDSLVWIYSEMSSSVLDYKGSWSGTGFAVGKPGEDVTYIVTNAHVIEQAYAWPLGQDDPFYSEATQRKSFDSLLKDYGMTINDLDIKTKIRVYYSEDSYDYDEPEIVYYSGPSEYDIAILKLDTPTDQVKPLLIRDSSGTSFKEGVVTMGFPDTFISDTNINAFEHDVDDIVVTECNILKFENKRGRKYRHMKLFNYYDNVEAYGPVFDLDGNVIGITTIIEGSSPLANQYDTEKNYALPSEELISILKAEKIEYTMTGPKYPEAQTFVFYSIFACVAGITMFIIAFIVYSIHKKRDPGTAVAVADASQTPIASVQNPVANNGVIVSSADTSNQISSSQETKPVAVSVASNNSTANNDQNNVYRRYNEFLITDKSITYKNIEYPYSSICNLVLLWNCECY